MSVSQAHSLASSEQPESELELDSAELDQDELMTYYEDYLQSGTYAMDLESGLTDVSYSSELQSNHYVPR